MRSIHIPFFKPDRLAEGRLLWPRPSKLRFPQKPRLIEKLAKSPGLGGIIIFGLILAAGMFYAASHLISDLSVEHATTIRPFIMLAGALLIALGFEFVNGFHDTANAVATVIYTHSLEPHVAVAWSGLCNFAGVLLSTGAVAFGILSLLPVELILQVGSSGGFAMVFALLVAAMIWNLGTWYLGLPASSSHTLIGSIIGVGIANQLMAVKTGTSGVDWGQAANIGKSLLVSPLVGFALAAALLLIAKAVITDKQLYEAPEGTAPPPFWIRGLLILTCTAVSFAHGSNDGQKGMGLIMLILIGLVPRPTHLIAQCPQARPWTLSRCRRRPIRFSTRMLRRARSSEIHATTCRNISGQGNTLLERRWRSARSSMTLPMN